MATARKLSLVYAVRDPDYGHDLLQRMQTSLTTFAAIARHTDLNYEFVVVEWNPPADKELIANLIDWDAADRGRLRFIEVPGRYHNWFDHAPSLPFLEYIAKNVGIRRANGEWIIACSPDVIFNQKLVHFFANERLQNDSFYRIDRRDVDCAVSLDMSLEERMSLCAQSQVLVNTAYGSIPIPRDKGGVRGKLRSTWTDIEVARQTIRLKREARKWHAFAAVKLLARPGGEQLLKRMKSMPTPLNEVHTNASGDFMLMHRDSWMRLKGYTQIATHAHIDSIMCWTAALNALRQRIITGPQRLFHQEHDRSSTTAFPVTDLLNWQEKTIVALAEGDGLISNDDSWGLPDEQFEEIVR